MTDEIPGRRRKRTSEEVAEQVIPSTPRATVDRAAEKPTGGPWGRVIDSVYDLDIEKTYRRLSDDLSLGRNATSYGEVLAALDGAERNYFDSMRLYRAAKLLEEEETREIESEMEILRTTAREALESEKTKGVVTIQMVNDRIMADWPEKSKRLMRRKTEVHGMARVIEGLADVWRSRCQSLRTMADKVSLVR